MYLHPDFSKILYFCIRESIRAGLAISIVLVLAALVLGDAASASEIAADGDSDVVTHPGEMSSGALLFRSAEHFSKAPVLHTDVHMSITGMIARVKVRQSFRNPGNEWQEGIYVFPLPETAAVDHLRMHVGERVIEGQIREKHIAKQQYQAARRTGKRASLVEQERPNIFTTSVANIGPNETIIVEIEYQQLSTFDLGEFSIRFPTVVGPRYIPGNTQVSGFSGSGWARNTDLVEDAQRITPPVAAPAHGKINPLSLSIDLDTGFRTRHIDSPHHAIKIEQQSGEGVYKIHLEEDSVPADRDFVLTWQAVAGSTPQAALFRETLGDKDYALLMVLPPESKAKHVLQREIIFVIDTSGSMAGTSIRQAKSALLLALGRLRQGDRFNVIQFNSYTSQLFPYPRSVSGRSLQQAHDYVSSLEARGGTEMAGAIRAALANQGQVAGLRQVVFLTDGSVGNEDALFTQIRNMLGDARLFTVGIGSAPNSHFMNRAASFGRGTHTYIGDLANVQQKMGKLFRKLETPVLGNISIDIEPSPGLEMWPQQIPDLYLGEPLLLSLKSDSLPRHLSISGDVAGARWSSSLSLDGGQQGSGVGALWARRKIAALMNQALRGTEKAALRQEAVATALEHHLVSQYTSLVAVDVRPVRKQDEALGKHAMAVNLPAGWQYNKVFGAMPRTATPATLYGVLGLALLLLSLLTRRFYPYV